ncbi:MAG: DUF554 domain-containing protein [Odoribacteraceae bacterium]|jgi:uncharacterized membrane protein YqgA involved in biofilm formation|nr:DUF554 domain-containing protein [Odoribacteraceae bacterium]
MIGTLVNAGAIIAGSLVGMMIRSRLSREIVNILFQAMGLVTIAVAIPMTFRSGNVALVVISVAAGAAAGQWLDLDGRVRRLSDRLRGKGARDEGEPASKFTEGFVTASMLFCVGSMAILGAIEEGTGKAPTLLLAKSVMDGITSIAFAASFGSAILFSSIPVLLYQGALTLFAAFMTRFMNEAMMNDLTSVGGILLIGLGITILKIKEINIINMLPALLFIACLSYFWG